MSDPVVRSLEWLEAALRAENERLRNERDRIQEDERVITCVFCGHEYPPGTPTANHRALREHVAVCPDHPAAVFLAERDALQATLDAVRALCDRQCNFMLPLGRSGDEVHNSFYAFTNELRAILNAPSVTKETRE